MAKSAVKFSQTLPLDDFFSSLGNNPRSAGISIEDRRGLGIVQVFARNGKTAATAKALGIKETPGKVTETAAYTAIPMSPGQWLLVSKKADAKSFATTVSKKLKSNGYVSEQSDARAVIRLSGKNARELMQKGCRLDLHPSSASKGWCAQTQMAQMGVTIHQVDDKPTYDLLVFSGFAQEFAEWLLHTGAQFGMKFSR